jgi:hypothetical protein
MGAGLGVSEVVPCRLTKLMQVRDVTMRRMLMLLKVLWMLTCMQFNWSLYTSTWRLRYACVPWHAGKQVITGHVHVWPLQVMFWCPNSAGWPASASALGSSSSN